MTNQTIVFEGEPIELPTGFAWKVHRQLTTTGLQRMDNMRFDQFDKAIHKWKDGNIHLFELRTQTLRCMAYCLIDNK